MTDEAEAERFNDLTKRDGLDNDDGYELDRDAFGGVFG
jgi:hypothetical protein